MVLVERTLFLAAWDILFLRRGTSTTQRATIGYCFGWLEGRR